MSDKIDGQLTRDLIASITAYNYKPEELRILQIHPQTIIEYVLWLRADNNPDDIYMPIEVLLPSVESFKPGLSEGCTITPESIVLEVKNMVGRGIITYQLTQTTFKVAIADTRKKTLFELFRGKRIPKNITEKDLQTLFVTHVATVLRCFQMSH